LWPSAVSCPDWGEHGLPLYKLLKKFDSFYWADETQKVLDDLKALISKPPILALPEPGETLLLYITATTQVICATLVVEQEEPGHVYKVNDRSSTLAKSYPTVRPVTIRYKSYSMPF
jgi:hypothetical protein